MVSFLTTISVVSMVMFIPGRSLPGKGGSSGISFGMQEARKRRINSALIRFIGCFCLFLFLQYEQCDFQYMFDFWNCFTKFI